MKEFFLTSIINQMMMSKENDLYLVEPISEKILCWKKAKEVGDTEKATILSNEGFKKSQKYAKLVRVNDKISYWKVYSPNKCGVEIFYVKTYDLNPKYQYEM